jgi:hypothetical protein
MAIPPLPPSAFMACTGSTFDTMESADLNIAKNENMYSNGVNIL